MINSPEALTLHKVNSNKGTALNTDPFLFITITAFRFQKEIIFVTIHEEKPVGELFNFTVYFYLRSVCTDFTLKFYDSLIIYF